MNMIFIILNLEKTIFKYYIVLYIIKSMKNFFKLIEDLPEPSLRFHYGESVVPHDIIRLKPYSYETTFEKEIRVIFPSNIESEVAKLFEIIQNGDSWPFERGINRQFNVNFNFKFTKLDEIDINKIESYIMNDESNILICFTSQLENYHYNRLKALSAIRRKRIQFINIQKFKDNFTKGNDIAKKFYALNLGVQLYSKGDGIPWLLTREVRTKGITYEFAPENSLIVGISFLRESIGGDKIYYGIAHVIDFSGLTLKFELFPAKVNPVTGYYIPREHMSKIVKDSIEYYREKKGSDLSKIYIYKTTAFIDEEIGGVREGLKESGDVIYYLNHVKTSGFVVRAYDLNDEDYCVRRGLCLIDLEEMRTILWTTGRLIGGKKSGRHKLGTPRPIEITVNTNSDLDKGEILRHIAYQALALTKLDWEHAMWEVRVPAILKYSRRAGKVSFYGNPVDLISRLDVRDLM